MKSNVGGIRLKLGTAVDSRPAVQQPQIVPGSSHLSDRGLADAIAASTVKLLLEGEMLDPASASDQLLQYGTSLEKGLHLGHGILQFLFPDEGQLEMVLVWLNSHSNLHVWEIANRIPPPETFYKAHPEILEACKLCGAVILDASSPSTMTTGSINPLTGDLLARWIQTELGSDQSETRPRFFFHVVIPAKLWSGIIRSHFGIDHVV